MNYEQFVCAMFECTSKKAAEDELVERQEMLKNNGVVAIGLTVRKKDSQVAPIIYLEEFYEKHLLGVPVEMLSEFLVRKSREIPPAPNCHYEEITDFSKIKNQVVYKLVNAEKNKKLLEKVPNLPILDFAIIFYWMVPAGDDEYGSVLIRNSHMNLWKIPISLLYQCAKQNTPRLLPCAFAPLSDFVKEFSGELWEESPLYILSNKMGLNGAASLLYPGMPGKIYEKLKRNYYLLPSSIHEFLVVPDCEMVEPENLRSIVQEVNATQLRTEELLSDNIYYFDGDIITKM